MSTAVLTPWLFTAVGAGACREFASLLDYPNAAALASWRQWHRAAPEWLANMPSISPDSAEAIGKFLAFADGQSLGALEELYAQTFDLQPQLTMHVGHRLFGDDWKRSALLIELKGLYDHYQVDLGGELPDHLVVVLRLLGAGSESGDVREFAGTLVRPAVRGLGRRLAPDNPYTGLLRALYLLLADAAGEAPESFEPVSVQEARP